MKRLFHNIKKRFGNGFTILLIPVSNSKTRSFRIPFFLLLIILGIISFNIYIAIGFIIQNGQIIHYYRLIAQQKQQINNLKHENRQLPSVIQKSNLIISEFDDLKKKQDKLSNTWASVKIKDRHRFTIANRGITIGNLLPAAINFKQLKGQTALVKLKNNFKQLSKLIDQESEAQQDLLVDLLAYEHKLDHTPSLWPVKSYITSGFGSRFHPIYKCWRRHNGIDFHANIGTTIVAAADGIVKKAAIKGGYGLCVIVDHGYGYQTIYAHNSRNIVREGQVVKKGQVICYSGNSGDSTGPHLHYEVRINGRPVNPVNFLN